MAGTCQLTPAPKVSTSAQLGIRYETHHGSEENSLGPHTITALEHIRP